MVNMDGTETDTSCTFIYDVAPGYDILDAVDSTIKAERPHHTPVRRLGNSPMTHGPRRAWLLASAARGRR